MKKCAVCDERLEGKRRDAVYCSVACKQYAHRKRRKVARVPQSASVPGTATVITIRTGEARPVREQPEGPPATPLVA